MSLSAVCLSLMRLTLNSAPVAGAEDGGGGGGGGGGVEEEEEVGGEVGDDADGSSFFFKVTFISDLSSTDRTNLLLSFFPVDSLSTSTL